MEGNEGASEEEAKIKKKEEDKWCGLGVKGAGTWKMFLLVNGKDKIFPCLIKQHNIKASHILNVILNGDEW
jgi:hypothetical protein